MPFKKRSLQAAPLESHPLSFVGGLFVEGERPADGFRSLAKYVAKNIEHRRDDDKGAKLVRYSRRLERNPEGSAVIDPDSGKKVWTGANPVKGNSFAVDSTGYYPWRSSVASSWRAAFNAVRSSRSGFNRDYGFIGLGECKLNMARNV